MIDWSSLTLLLAVSLWGLTPIRPGYGLSRGIEGPHDGRIEAPAECRDRSVFRSPPDSLRLASPARPGWEEEGAGVGEAWVDDVSLVACGEPVVVGP